MIYLEEFAKAKAASVAIQEQRGEDPTCAGLTVVAEVDETVCYQQRYESTPELPDDLASIDDAFLDRVRALASFI